MRTARLDRLLAAMADHDLDLLVLGRVANIRYASGVPILWNAGTRPYGPGAVVIRDTREVFLLSTWDEGVPEEIDHDHLFGITWNPMNYVSLLTGIAEDHHPARVGTDATSPLFAQLLPMAFSEAAIVDGSDALRAARRTKTPEEVDAIRAAVRVAEVGLAAAMAELRPGIDERELTGVFMDAMASQGVTTPATQEVARITSARAGAAPTVADGDLVAFSAGVVADGYVGEVGRTVAVGTPGAGDDRAADAFARAERLTSLLVDACRPGAPGTALFDAYAAAGEPVPLRPIGCGLGLGFDDPVIVRDLPESAARERLDPGVVVVVTACVFDDDVGTVITQQPVLVTADGPEVLASSPTRAVTPLAGARA